MSIKSTPCPHILKVWHEVPHPRYGDARQHFIALPMECGGQRSHDGDHERFGRSWR